MAGFSNRGRAQVSQEEIEKRAYEVYLQRGGDDGMDLEDWLVAERELLGALERTDVPEGPNVPLYSHKSSSDTTPGEDSEVAQNPRAPGRSAVAGDRRSS